MSAKAELWIQVDVGLASSKLIDRCREVCNVSTNEAIGLFIRLWSAVLRVGCAGDLRERSNTWIEEETGWRGEPGKFAAFVRDQHLEDGVIRDWPEKYGKLEAMRADARQTKANQRAEEAARRRVEQAARRREESADCPSDSPIDGPPDDGVDSSSSSSSSAVSVFPEPRTTKLLIGREGVEDEAALSARLLSDIDRSELIKLLDSVPNCGTWVAEMSACLDGMPGHAHLSPTQLGEAIRDFLGNGATASPSLKHFRGYLKNAAQAPLVPHPLVREPRRRPGGVAQRTFDNGRHALEGL